MTAALTATAAWAVVLAVGALALVHWLHGHQLDNHRDAVHDAARHLEALQIELKHHRSPQVPAAKSRPAYRDVVAASPDTRTTGIPRADLAAAIGDLTVGDRYGVPRLGPDDEPCMSIHDGHPCMRGDEHDPPHLDVDTNGRITHIWTDSTAGVGVRQP